MKPRRRRLLHGARVLALSLALASPAGAQLPDTGAVRSGFWWGGTLAMRSLTTHCPDCGELPDGSIGVALTAGWTLGRHLTVGAEQTYWMSDYAPRYLTQRTKGDIGGSSSVALVSFYPLARRGLFASAGVGYAEMKAEPWLDGKFDDATIHESRSGAVRLGLGYDVHMRRRLALRIEVTNTMTFAERVSVGGAPSSSRLRPHLDGIAFGLVWQ